MARGVALGAALLTLVTAAAVAAAGRATAQTADPFASAAIVVSPASGAPGAEVVVELVNWPDGPVLVGVCGNNARRGSEDCNLVGTRGAEVRAGRATFRLRVAAPPVHCPCVIRATTPTGVLVRHAPFAVDGVANGPELLPAGGAVSAADVRIRARLEGADKGPLRNALPVVAGPVHKTLVMTIRNGSDRTVEEVRVVGAVGRSRDSAEPITSTTVTDLQAGATETVRIPVRIGVPAWGEYEVFGSVYGLDVPSRFSTTTANDPWGLQLAIPAVLLLLAWWARRRERATEADEGLTVDPLQESSPAVGVLDDGRSPAHPYAPAHAPSEA